MAAVEACCATKAEPKYTTPLDAIKGPREGLVYVTCETGLLSEGRRGLTSPTYSTVIHQLLIPHDGTLAAPVTMILPPLEDSSSFLPCYHSGSTLSTQRIHPLLIRKWMKTAALPEKN